MTDVDGTIVFTNPPLDALFEYGPGELIGRPVEALVPPEAASGHPELRRAYGDVPYRRIMGSGRDLQGLTRSGRLLSVEIGLNAMEVDGRRHLVASVLDVSALRAAERKTRMAMDASASAMVMVDAEARIVLANRQAVSLFGYAEEDLLGRPIEILVPERLRRRHEVYRSSYTSAPTQLAMGERGELRGRRIDGSEFPLEIGLTPLEEQGQHLVMATIIDITERKRAEEEITRQNADLVRLNGELTQFAYSASHDLRAPLTSLDGLLHCIEEDLDDGDLDQARLDSRQARELAERLARLIEDVLGFARAENLDPTITDVDLATLVDQVGVDLGAVLADNGVDLRNRVEPGRTVRTDRRRVAQILRNLVSNGAKYADPGVADPFVAVELVTDGDRAEIRVSDNGIGIPPANRDQVFGMFRRFSNHDQPGSGLGLALVKKHVDQLGGSVTLMDTPAGTTFSVRLPIIAAGDAGDGSPLPAALEGAGDPR